MDTNNSHADQPSSDLPPAGPQGLTPLPVPPVEAAETLLWQGRTNWKHHVGLLALGAAWTVAAFIFAWRSQRAWLDSTLTWMTVLAWGVILARLGYSLMNVRYRLTSQRLFIERGILSRTIDQTELIRVDDVRIYKTLLDRILGLGSIQIFSTDASHRDLKIVGVAGPETIADHIRRHMRQLRQKSLYVENL